MLCTHQLTHWGPFFLLLGSEKEIEKGGEGQSKRYSSDLKSKYIFH